VREHSADSDAPPARRGDAAKAAKPETAAAAEPAGVGADAEASPEGAKKA